MYANLTSLWLSLGCNYRVHLHFLGISSAWRDQCLNDDVTALDLSVKTAAQGHSVSQVSHCRHVVTMIPAEKIMGW